MNEDRKCSPDGDLPLEEDDIEIIEVVGFEDAAAALDGYAEEDKDAITLSFEEDEVPEEDENSGGDGVPAQPGNIESPVARESFRRLQADFENYKKRVEREREEFDDRATDGLVERMLPVLDNFERALDSREPGGTGDDFAKGVALIHRQFLDELKKQGLKPVDALGDTFDPMKHEAVATEAVSAEDVETVLEEFQRGYYFRGRLLRPALVKVGVAEPPTQDEED